MVHIAVHHICVVYNMRDIHLDIRIYDGDKRDYCYCKGQFMVARSVCYYFTHVF